MGWDEPWCPRCGKIKGDHGKPYYGEDLKGYVKPGKTLKPPPRFRNEQEWCDYQYHLIKNGHRNN
jgi:hypothetical protein